MEIDPQSIVVALGFIVAVILGIFYTRSGLVKQRQSELADLAQTRGDTIEDLRQTLGELQLQVAQLRGQVDALLSFKSDEIADRVVEKLGPFLGKP